MSRLCGRSPTPAAGPRRGRRKRSAALLLQTHDPTMASPRAIKRGSASRESNTVDSDLSLSLSCSGPGFGNEFRGRMLAVLQALALARRSRGAGSSNISQQTSRSTPHVGMQEAHVAQPQILRKHHQRSGGGAYSAWLGVPAARVAPPVEWYDLTEWYDLEGCENITLADHTA